MNVEKDLGVLISPDFSWNNHIDFIASKAQRMLINVFHRTFSDTTYIKKKKMLYVAWVRSRLDNASRLWSPRTKRNMNKIEQIQRRATKVILGKDLSENERLRKLNLPPYLFIIIMTSHGKTYTNVRPFNGRKRPLAVSHRH